VERVRFIDPPIMAARRNCMRCGLRASASRQIASTSARTLRVSRGSITPSSSTARWSRTRHLAVEHTDDCAFIASIFPSRPFAAPVSGGLLTIAMVSGLLAPIRGLDGP